MGRIKTRKWIHLTLITAILGTSLFFFQNCGKSDFETLESVQEAIDNSSLGGDNAVCNSGETQEGYTKAAALYPQTCGQKITKTCVNGKWDHDEALYETCAQQCVHPDNGQAVSVGFEYYTFTQAQGANQAACDGAKQTSYCDAATGTFVPALAAHRTCAVEGQTCAYTMGANHAVPTGNNENATVTGFTMSTATYPATCGSQVTRTCMANGSWNGSTPLYISCTQKCLHPDTNQPVDANTSYVYYTKSTGLSAGECNAAKVTSTCQAATGQFSPAVAGTRYSSCTVQTVKSAYSLIKAVDADVKVGTTDEPKDDPNPTSVGYIDGGDYLTFKNLDFEDGAQSVTFNIALIKEASFDPNSKMEIREGSNTGKVVGVFVPKETGSWTNFQDQQLNLTSTISGVKDVTLTFVGNKGVLNLKNLIFSKNKVSNPTPDPEPEPEPNQPSPGGYGTREKPFSADSPFNTPIPSKAVYSSSSDPRTKDWQTTVKANGAYTTGNTWTMWVWETNRNRTNAKLITVKVFDMLCYSSNPPAAYKVSFWAPNNATPPTGTDAHFLVVDDKDILHEMYFAKTSPTCYCSNRCNGLAESGVDYYVNSYHKIPLTSTGVGNVGGRMTGFSGLGGLIRAGEITNVNGPQIEHAIALTIKGAGGDPSTPLSSGYVYPASRTGSRGEWKASLRSGERLALPKSVNVEAMPIPETHKRLARALQKYGGYIADVGGNNAVWTDGVAATGDKAALDSNTAAIKLILEQLVAVDNSF